MAACTKQCQCSGDCQRQEEHGGDCDCGYHRDDGDQPSIRRLLSDVMLMRSYRARMKEIRHLVHTLIWNRHWNKRDQGLLERLEDLIDLRKPYPPRKCK